MSHSKRNTSRAVFTSYEYSLAKAAWGATSARLSRDSFLPFASCRLCLLPARTPVSCPLGDIFCRECALQNILSQKLEIKRLEKVRERDEREALENLGREEAEARQRSEMEFEKVQMGLEDRSVGGAVNSMKSASAGCLNTGNETLSREQKGLKRKFILDPDEILRINREETDKARKSINDEKAAKPTLPSFWVPSNTPSSNTKNTLHIIPKKTKLSPICPESSPDTPHVYALNSLIDVIFTEEKDRATGLIQQICPACKRVLSNNSKVMLVRVCGHVLCKGCVGKFMTPGGVCDPHAPDQDQNKITCYVCNADVTEVPDKGMKRAKLHHKAKAKSVLIEIRCEGTGFASGGSTKVEKKGIAFQC